MAKKKGRKKKRKMRRPKPEPERNTTLVPRLREQGLLKDQEILYEPEGFEKTSAMVLELIEPYMEYPAGRENFEALIRLAIMAWNISMLPDGGLQVIIDKVAEDTPVFEREGIADLLEEVMERKRKLFPYNTRIISGHELTETEDGYNLAVASSVGVVRDIQERNKE